MLSYFRTTTKIVNIAHYLYITILHVELFRTTTKLVHIAHLLYYNITCRAIQNNNKISPHCAFTILQYCLILNKGFFASSTY